MPPRIDLTGKQPGMNMVTGVIKSGVNLVSGAVQGLKGAVRMKQARMK